MTTNMTQRAIQKLTKSYEDNNLKTENSPSRNSIENNFVNSPSPKTRQRKLKSEVLDGSQNDKISALIRSMEEFAENPDRKLIEQVKLKLKSSNNIFKFKSMAGNSIFSNKNDSSSNPKIPKRDFSSKDTNKLINSYFSTESNNYKNNQKENISKNNNEMNPVFKRSPLNENKTSKIVELPVIKTERNIPSNQTEKRVQSMIPQRPNKLIDEVSENNNTKNKEYIKIINNNPHPQLKLLAKLEENKNENSPKNEIKNNLSLNNKTNNIFFNVAQSQDNLASTKTKFINNNLILNKNYLFNTNQKTNNIHHNLNNNHRFKVNGRKSSKKIVLPIEEENEENKYIKVKSHSSNEKIENLKKPIIKRFSLNPNSSNFNLLNDFVMTGSDSTSEDENSNIIKYLIKNYASQSQPGTNEYGRIKTNQDSYLIINNIFNLDNFNIFGMFDGHGTNGHLVSGEVTNYFSEFFTKYSNYKSQYSSSDFKSTKYNLLRTNDLDYSEIKEEIIYEKLVENHYEVIRNAFRTADDQLHSGKYDINMSGCTSNLVFIVKNKIICANVGDSRAILVNHNKLETKSTRNLIFYNKNKNKTKINIENLSIDHKPNLEVEKKRIISCGGQVDKQSADRNNDDSPYRVYIRNENYPGLAMSRAMGDKIAKKVGVISDPEIIEFDIKDDSKYIVIASDGIWEFLTNSKVVNIVNPYYLNNDPNGACKALVEAATELWEKKDHAVDDITVTLIFFNLS